MLCLSVFSAAQQKNLIFVFLFAASETSLRFQTLLVQRTLPAAGVSLVLLDFSLRPAAVKCCSGSISWDSHRCRCTLYRILLFERLGMSESGWLVVWLPRPFSP